MRQLQRLIWRNRVLNLGLLALVLVGAAGLAYLAFTQDVPPIVRLQPVIFVAAYALVLVRGVMRGEHTLRTVQRYLDDQQTAVAAEQPDAARALMPGEQVTLRLHTSAGSVWLFALNVTGRLVLFTLIIEVLLAPFIPALSPLSLLFPDLALNIPLWLQWFVAATPVLIAIVIIWTNVFTRIRGVAQTIVADDRGLTIQKPLGGLQFVAWDAIRHVVRLLITTGDQTLGIFLLANERQYIELRFIPILAVRNASMFSKFAFEPPQPTYRDGAERILATLAVRTGLPMRAVENRTLINRPSTLPNTFGIAAQDVAQMPLAPTAWQPPAQALEWARAYPAAYEIAAAEGALMSGSVNHLRRIPQRLRLAITIPGTLLLLSLALLPNDLIWLLGKIYLCLVIALILFRVLAVPTIRSRPVRIIADPFGLRRQGQNEIFIPWQSVRAWGIMPPTANRPNPVYAVFWEGPTLAWIEAQPGTRDAKTGGVTDRAAAEALHALIIARAGQPLHVIWQG